MSGQQLDGNAHRILIAMKDRIIFVAGTCPPVLNPRTGTPDLTSIVFGLPSDRWLLPVESVPLRCFSVSIDGESMQSDWIQGKLLAIPVPPQFCEEMRGGDSKEQRLRGLDHLGQWRREAGILNAASSVGGKRNRG
jgi:hypothetical protein